MDYWWMVIEFVGADTYLESPGDGGAGINLMLLAGWTWCCNWNYKKDMVGGFSVCFGQWWKNILEMVDWYGAGGSGGTGWWW